MIRTGCMNVRTFASPGKQGYLVNDIQSHKVDIKIISEIIFQNSWAHNHMSVGQFNIYFSPNFLRRYHGTFSEEFGSECKSNILRSETKLADLDVSIALMGVSTHNSICAVLNR